MTRARLLKPGFFLNEELAELPYPARILFEALWCIADRAGRLEDRPKRIKHEALPYDNEDVDDLLKQLHAAGFIMRYAVDGARYIQVVNFSKHQSPHIHEAQSVIPAPGQPSGQHGTSTVQAPCEHDTSTSYSNPIAVPDPESVDTSDSSVSAIPSFVADANASSDEQNAHAHEDAVTPPPTPAKASGGKKRPPEPLPSDSEAVRLATLLRDSILAHTPDARVPKTLDKLQTWAHVVDLMLTRDHRAPPDIEAVIAFATTDTFWQANILSPGSLREKFDPLNIKRRTQREVRDNGKIAVNGHHGHNGYHGQPRRREVDLPDHTRNGIYAGAFTVVSDDD